MGFVMDVWGRGRERNDMDEEIESTTHDAGELWSSKARIGWCRCVGCGEEWESVEESGCECGEGEEGCDEAS